MNRLLLLIFVYFAGLQAGNFHKYFNNETMRIDYTHVGDSRTQWVTIDQIYRYSGWAGTQNHLIDPIDNGKYFLKIYDAKSGQMIYSRGFSSYFGEYQTTPKAQAGIKRAYHESAIIPFPRDSIKFVLQTRDSLNQLYTIFETIIDPNRTGIICEKPDPDIEVIDYMINGPVESRVDLAFIGEGYTRAERDTFLADLQHFSQALFNQEPFKSYKNKFNVRGIIRYSAESGCDEPTHNSYKNTTLGATFNSMGSPRYLLTENNKALHDVASAAPYDALLIMVNHDRYGGGGIYNFYLTFTTGNIWRDYVMIHEFGHSFAGLGDEYYSSATAYDEFYPAGVEPVEPNVTALLDPQNLKWRNLVEADIPIPTPWNKEAFDKAGFEYSQRRQEYNRSIAELERRQAPRDSILMLQRQADLASRNNQARRDSLMRESKYWGKTGAFEGAGYLSRGLYRPRIDCIMFSQGVKDYCPVCEQAIVKMIQYYTE